MGRSKKMKFNYLIKATPLLTISLLIIFLSISNPKKYIKLRILIWNTPSLSLATYLAISSGTGFIFSYFITSNLAKLDPKKQIQSLNYKVDDKYYQNNEYTKSRTNHSYEKTLIERDINDPSPTIDASFRIIGRTDNLKSNFIENNKVQYDDSIEYNDEYYEKSDKEETMNQENSLSGDWNDESYSKW